MQASQNNEYIYMKGVYLWYSLHFISVLVLSDSTLHISCWCIYLDNLELVEPRSLIVRISSSKDV
jgi:hypothetical protein